MTTVPGAPTAETPGGDVADVPEDTPTIAIDVVERDGATVVSVRGEVDMVTTPRLHACLQDRLSRTPERLVVDMSGLIFLGSSGLAVLVESLDTARTRGTDLRLVCNSREVVRPLEVTGLTELFQTYSDLNSALAW